MDIFENLARSSISYIYIYMCKKDKSMNYNWWEICHRIR